MLLDTFTLVKWFSSSIMTQFSAGTEVFRLRCFANFYLAEWQLADAKIEINGGCEFKKSLTDFILLTLTFLHRFQILRRRF